MFHACGVRGINKLFQVNRVNYVNYEKIMDVI